MTMFILVSLALEKIDNLQKPQVHALWNCFLQCKCEAILSCRNTSTTDVVGSMLWAMMKLINFTS